MSKTSSVVAAFAFVAVATVCVVVSVNSGDETEQRSTELQKLDVVQVSVPGAGTSEIHAGSGTEVHQFKVNSVASLPDLTSSIVALKGELAKLKQHAATLKASADKVAPSAGNSEKVAQGEDEYLSYLNNHIATLKEALKKALPKSRLSADLTDSQKADLNSVQSAAKELELEVGSLKTNFRAKSVFADTQQAAKLGVSSKMVQKLFDSIDDLENDVKFGVNGLLNPAEANTMPIENLMKASKVVEESNALIARANKVPDVRQWLMKLSHGMVDVVTADADSKTAIQSALKLAQDSAKQGLKTSKAEESAADESIRAAQSAASSVIATGDKTEAAQAAVIAAAAIMASRELGKAVKDERVTAAEIADANSIAASVQTVEARAKQKAAAELTPGTAKVIGLMKGITILSDHVKEQAEAAKKIAPSIVNAAGAKALHSSVDDAHTFLKRAQLSATQMEQKILDAVRMQSEQLVKANMLSGKLESAALEKAMKAQKDLRMARKNALEIEVLNAGGASVIPKQLQEATASVNKTKLLAQGTDHAALFKSSQESSSLSAAVQLNLAKESMDRLGVLDEAAVHVVRENLDAAEKEVAEDDKAAMRTATIAADNVKVTDEVSTLAKTTKDASKMVSDHTKKVANANLKAVTDQAKIEAEAADIAAGDMQEDVDKAKHAAEVMASAVGKARGDLKTDVGIARDSAESVNSLHDKVTKVIRDEAEAAEAAERDGERKVAENHRAQEAEAKKKALEGKTYVANANAELQSVRAEETAVKSAEGMAIDSLQTSADSAAILSKANAALSKGITTAQKAVSDAGEISKAESETSEAQKSIKEEAHQLSQGSTFRTAKAWGAAMSGAAASLEVRRTSDSVTLHHLRPEVVAWAISSTQGQTASGTRIVQDLQKADVKLTAVAVGAACKEAGMKPAQVAKALRRMGASAVDTAKALSIAGSATSGQAIAQAMASDGGFSSQEIASALSNAGYVSEISDIKTVLSNCGLNMDSDAIKRAVESNIGAAPGIQPNVPSVLKSGGFLSQRASAVISEMRAEGVKLDPLNIAAALMKANLSPEEVAQSMIALGVKPSVVETAMGSKYGSAIARAVAFTKAEGGTLPGEDVDGPEGSSVIPSN